MLESSFKTLRTFLGENFWVSEVLLIILLVLLAHFFLRCFHNRLRTECIKTKNIWDDALLAAVRRPAEWVVWIVGLTFAAQFVALKIDAEWLQLGAPIRSIGIIIAIGWFLIGLDSQSGAVLCHTQPASAI